MNSNRSINPAGTPLCTFIEANAGTGKTRRLTDFIIQRVNQGLSLQRVCAVTFTEKAANEMVERIRSSIVEAIQSDNKPPSLLDDLNGAFIGTIHSFCNLLLKRNGERIGIAPLFEVDDQGTRFESLYQSKWDQFLSEVLRKGVAPYSHLLDTVNPGTLNRLSQILASRGFAFQRPDPLDIHSVIIELKNPKNWGVTPKNKWPGTLLRAMENFDRNRDVLQLLSETVMYQHTEWKRAIQEVLHCRTDQIHTALEALQRDFVSPLLKEYRQLGYMRFDDLILDARDILRQFPDVRRRLKNRYDLILVDEMQDTDPVQYEIFLYLAESNDRESDFTLQQIVTGQKQLRLEPGKLFVVGDPKQSIYGFRRADVRAYSSIQDIMLKEGVEIDRLTDNYRSCTNLVLFTNFLAHRLFADETIVDSIPRKTDYCTDQAMQDCVRLVAIRSQNADTQHLRVLTEAHWLARTIKRMVEDQKVRYQDIAILMRRLTSAHLYLDALSGQNIPVVIEGEKYFFLAQEVIDFLNVLKWVVDDMDSIALAGVLRSPLFALDDLELVRFFRSFHENLNPISSLTECIGADSEGRLDALLTLMDRLLKIRNDLKSLTPGSLVDHVLCNLPVLSVASTAYGTYRSDIAPLNILKIRKQAFEADQDPAMTPYRFVRILESYSREARDFGQEAVADEGVDAVRMMSIHKSKGLDFPVVFLTLSDYGFRGQEDNPRILHDWKTDTIGIKVNGLTDSNYIHLKYLSGLEFLSGEESELSGIGEEERRVLYVGATRAKKALWVTFAPLALGKTDNGKGKQIFHFLSSLIEDLPEIEVEGEPWPDITREEDEKPEHAPLMPVLEKWQSIVRTGGRRSIPFITAVTREAKTETDRDEFYVKASPEGAQAVLTGLMCHAILQKIDLQNTAGFRQLLQQEKGRFSDRYSQRQVEESAGESERILEIYFQSDSARWIASSEVLGREVPITSFDQPRNKILTGVIDLLVRNGDKYYVIDYKSNIRIDTSEMETYRHQMKLYADAVEPVLQTRPLTRLCLLRSGEFIDV